MHRHTSNTMNYEPLALFCRCGRSPDQIAKIGLTSQRQLVVHWQCTDCGESVVVFKGLSDCWRECPSRPDSTSDEASEDGSDIRAEDFAFLDSIGITIPGEWDS